MTKSSIAPARPESARPARVRFRILAALALLLPLPALAQQAVADSRVALPEAVSLPDRALNLAVDINGMLAAGKAAAVSQDYVQTDSRVRRLLNSALTLLGTPYRWGGTSPEQGFDCSGLVSYVFRNAMGIELPRVSREQARAGELVADRSALAEGDLVFFGRRGRVDHVGIYLGEGRFVHAPSRGKDVTVSSLDTGYWAGKFMQARRIGAGS